MHYHPHYHPYNLCHAHFLSIAITCCHLFLFLANLQILSSAKFNGGMWSEATVRAYEFFSFPLKFMWCKVCHFLLVYRPLGSSKWCENVKWILYWYCLFHRVILWILQCSSHKWKLHEFVMVKSKCNSKCDLLLSDCQPIDILYFIIVSINSGTDAWNEILL